jgi:hypothetical protein
MNLFNFIMADAVSTVILGYFAGWVIGIIIWILRFIMIDVPHGGMLKGGDML